MENEWFPFRIGNAMNLMMLLSTRYAFSDANKHKSTSIRIAIGLGLCLYAISTVLSFMQALQDNQFDDIRTFETFDLQMPLSTHDLNEATQMATQLESLSMITDAFVYADMPVIVQNASGKSLAGRIRAIDAKGRFNERLNSYRGQLFETGKLASSFINATSIKLGETVGVTLLKKGRQAVVIPTLRNLEVGSLYYTSMYEFDSVTFLTDLPTLLALNAEVQLNIGFFTDADIASAQKQIEALGLGSCITWIEANASLYSAMKLEQHMMTLMLFLMVAVVLVHIRNSSRRLLLAKQREIAMIRSMGFTKARVQGVFVLQSALVAIVGCLGGVMLSYATIHLYPSFSSLVFSSMGVQLKVQIEFLQILLLSLSIILFSVFAAFLGTHRILGADIMEMFTHDEVK